MILNVDFVSRIKAEAMPAQDDLAVISISEPDVDAATLSVPEERVLRLAFHDVDPGNEQDRRWHLFDDEHAHKIIRFVEQLHTDPRPYQLIAHCRAGISRSAAIALFAADVTGCEFARRPFSGLANRHLLKTLNAVSGRSVKPPRALPRREKFSVSVARDFSSGLAQVTVINVRSKEQAVMEGPLLQVPELAAAGMQQVWGLENPPPSYHVKDWDALV